MSPAPSGTPPRGADYLRIVGILGGLTAMGPLAIDMYLPALPAIARDLQASPVLVQASLAAYFIGIAMGQALYGPFSDRWGRKPALYLGLSVFTLSSVACALTAQVELLIACRFLQALGGCAPLVVPRAVVRDHFDQQDSVRALSLLILVMGLAPILAPLIGGQLLIAWGWRAIFWLLAGYGAVSLTVVSVLLPESLPTARPPGAADRRGAGHLRPAARQPRVHGLGTVGRDDLLRAPGLHLRVVVRLHRAVQDSPRAFRPVLRRERHRPDCCLTGQRLAGGPLQPETGRERGDAHCGGCGAGARRGRFHGFAGFAGLLVPLFCFVACLGFVMPSTTALAMAPHGAVAGSASALLGTVQFTMGATAGALVGLLGNGTAVPFGAVIAFCGVGGLLVLKTVAEAGGPTNLHR